MHSPKLSSFYLFFAILLETCFNFYIDWCDKLEPTKAMDLLAISTEESGLRDTLSNIVEM